MDDTKTHIPTTNEKSTLRKHYEKSIINRNSKLTE